MTMATTDDIELTGICSRTSTEDSEPEHLIKQQ